MHLTPEQIRKLAAEYVGQPDATAPEVVNGWRILANYVGACANQVRQVLDVRPVDNGDPYFDHLAQSADIERNGRFLVSRLNCVHPVFTPEQNVDLRIYHDVRGHHDHGLSFSAADEFALWALTVRYLPLSRPALEAFTVEFLYQTAYVTTTGSYLQRTPTLGPVARTLLNSTLGK